MHHASLSMLHAQVTIANMKNLGPLISQAREAAGLQTQKDLAEKIGKDPSWVSRLERGLLKEMPGPEDVQKIAKALDLTQSEILTAAGYELEGAGEEESLASRRLTPYIKRIGDNEALLRYVEEGMKRDIRFYTSIQRGERELPG